MTELPPDVSLTGEADSSSSDLPSDLSGSPSLPGSADVSGEPGGVDNGRSRPIPVRVQPAEGGAPPLASGRNPGGSTGRQGGRGPRPGGRPPPERERRPQPGPEEVTPELSAEEVPPVRFLVGEVEWVARAAGQSASSRATGAAAPVLLVTFAPAATPDQPTHECLRIGRSLHDVTDDELADLLGKARPYVRLPPREGLFTETRVGKKGER